jgi:hypothetical protein
MQLTKKKTAILALALIFCIGIASAALLDYYAHITTTVTVAEQAVLVDGKGYAGHEWEEAVAIDYGGNIVKEHHTLEDKSQTPVWVQLWTSEMDYFTVTYGFTLQSTNEQIEGYEIDALVIKAPEETPLTEFESITYTYTLLGCNNNYMKPFVVLMYDNDGDGKIDGMLSTPQYDGAVLGTPETVTWTKDDFTIKLYDPPTDDAKLVGVKIDIGWQGSAQTNPGYQRVYLENIKGGDILISKSGIVVALTGTLDKQVCMRFLEFDIIYKSDVAIKPSEYTFESYVRPIGEAEVTYHP